MPDRSEFGRRFAELIAAHGENRSAAAKRLRKTPGYISQLVRGLGTPSADFLDEILAAYGISHERDEWRAICGFPYDPSLSAAVNGASDLGRQAGEAFARQAFDVDYFLAGFDRLVEDFPDRSIALERLRGGLRAITREKADSVLQDLRERLERGEA